MEQDSKRITNRRNFLMSFGAAAGVALYPETLSFAQASGASLATLDIKMKDRYPSVQVDRLA